MKPRAWLVVAIALLLAWQWWGRASAPAAPPSLRPAAEAPARTPGPAAATPSRSAPGTVAEDASEDARSDNRPPPEARQTLRLIQAGGPFPYERDGAVFGNYEHRLPKRARGYYREYTVPTPGLSHRGLRRIIAGGDPPQEFWYTGDHYDSFRRLEATP